MPQKTRLKVGDAAPDFTLPAVWTKPEVTTGEVTLSHFRGRKNVLIAFHPLAWTGVCALQMKSYEEQLCRFEELDAVVLGISVDSRFSKEAWAQSLGGISFPLLSDFPAGKVAKAYGVLRKEGFSQRALFLVDKQGVIRYMEVHEPPERPDDEVVFAALRRLKQK
jgi:peroxiredoxin (alkyl hydroperoxide reductase subunit C)